MASSSTYWEPTGVQIWGMTEKQSESGLVTHEELEDFNRVTARCEACQTPFVLFIRKGLFVRQCLCYRCFPWLGQDLPDVRISC